MDERPKVLHVWDIGGNGAALAKVMGHDCIHRASNDPYHGTRMYSDRFVVRGGPRWFYAQAWWRARSADLLHIHGGHRMAERLAVRKMDYERPYPSEGGMVMGRDIVPRKPYILHYHGSDVWDHQSGSRRIAELGAARILVSTPDLLKLEYEKEPTYVPTPIDTGLFARRDIPNNNRGLAILIGDQGRDDTLRRLREYGFGDIEWTFRRRQYGHGSHGSITMHKDMPAMLSKYQYYCDFKWNRVHNKWHEATSQTALECMSLGMSTILHDGSVRDTLPDEHRLENVAERIGEIHREAMETRGMMVDGTGRAVPKGRA
ncbi:MAG: hypothetical protein IS632_08750 [Thaumarchaeota archaeon]|nr:hypothetical protein [Nitrososphaerota archaeon]